MALARSARSTPAHRPRSWLYCGTMRRTRFRQLVRTSLAYGEASRIAIPLSASSRNTAGSAAAGPLKRASNGQSSQEPTPYLRTRTSAWGAFCSIQGVMAAMPMSTSLSDSVLTMSWA